MPASRDSRAVRGKERRVLSRAQRRTLTLIATLAFALTASVACVVVFLDEPMENAQAVTDDRPPDQCAAQPTYESCQSIEVDGHSWRYALYRSSTATSRTVVFDPGGPGTAVLSGNYTLAEQPTALALSDYNLLVLEEPWVTAELTEGCDDALTGYYSSARALEFSPAASSVVHAECDLENSRYGFDQQSYQALVQAVSSLHELDIEGFIGHSFGSVRLAYLDASESLRPSWAAITRPFPLGASSEDVLDARAAVIEEHFPDGTEAIGDTELPDRSLPVGRFDQLSAMIGTGYTEDEALPAMTEAIRTGSDLPAIGSLSDQLWMRYGTDSISIGMLAYWQELCTTVGGASDSTGGDQWHALLDYQTGPCDQAEVIAPAWSEGLRLCVTASAGDSVVPGELVAATFSGYPIEWSEVRSHGDITGIDSCLEKIR